MVYGDVGVRMSLGRAIGRMGPMGRIGEGRAPSERRRLAAVGLHEANHAEDFFRVWGKGLFGGRIKMGGAGRIKNLENKGFWGGQLGGRIKQLKMQN